VSLFEPHSEIIRKGKASKPNEFGNLVIVQEAENQIITHYEVFAERPEDSRLLISAVEQHRRRFGRAPRMVAADAGFYLNYAQIDLCGCVASFSCHGVCLSSRAIGPWWCSPDGVSWNCFIFLCIKSYARRWSAMKSCWYHWSEPVGAFPDGS
jgi:hypothetical protein